MCSCSGCVTVLANATRPNSQSPDRVFHSADGGGNYHRIYHQTAEDSSASEHRVYIGRFPRQHTQTALNGRTNDTDADDRVGSGRLGVLVAPSVGTARTARLPGAHDSVGYRSDRSGYDVFIYEVCDRLRNCHSAEATIVVRASPGVAVP